MLAVGTAQTPMATTDRRTRAPLRSRNQQAAWDGFLAECELTPEQTSPPPKDKRFQVSVHLDPDGDARRALLLWSAHFGTAGFGDLARTLVLAKLRELGRPPGWVGKWDPDDLF